MNCLSGLLLLLIVSVFLNRTLDHTQSLIIERNYYCSSKLTFLEFNVYYVYYIGLCFRLFFVVFKMIGGIDATQ